MAPEGNDGQSTWNTTAETVTACSGELIRRHPLVLLLFAF